jgi:hypothetical protein
MSNENGFLLDSRSECGRQCLWRKSHDEMGSSGGQRHPRILPGCQCEYTQVRNVFTRSCLRHEVWVGTAAGHRMKRCGTAARLGPRNSRQNLNTAPPGDKSRSTKHVSGCTTTYNRRNSWGHEIRTYILAVGFRQVRKRNYTGASLVFIDGAIAGMHCTPILHREFRKMFSAMRDEV